MVRILSLVLLFNLGCASSFTLESPVVIDSAFDSYVREFELECSEFRVDCKVESISIRLGPLDWPKLGVCIKYENGDRVIIMNDRTWEVLTPLSRMNLFRHELGHCKFNYPHNDNILSIMNSSLIADSYYNEALLQRFYMEGF